MKISSTGSSDAGSAPGLPGSVDSAERRAAARYVLVFAAGMLAALALAEWLLRSFVVPIEDGRANRVHVVYNAVNPDVVLGDSHLYRAFLNDPRFENLARGGSSPGALEIVAREYFRHLEPGRVIVEASPQLFSRIPEKRGSQRHDGFFTMNWGLPLQAYVFEPGISREIARLWDIPGLLHEANVARQRHRTDGGFVKRIAKKRLDLTASERRRMTRERIDANRPVAGVRRSESFAAYRRTIEALLERGARVCMANSPVTQLYLDMSADDARFVEADEAIRELAVGRSVPFVDFRDLGLELDVTAFTNPDHVSTITGERYSSRLVAACYPELAVEGDR